jgi:hypothetical protein
LPGTSSLTGWRSVSEYASLFRLRAARREDAIAKGYPRHLPALIAGTLPHRRAEARPRPGPRRSSATLPMRRSRLPIFTMSNSAVSSLPVRCCARVLCLSFFLSASDPPTEGWRSAGRRYPLFCRARNRATPRLRGVGRPAQPGRRLTALHRDGFGPSPRSAPPELPPGAPGGRPSLPGACVRSAEGPEPPGHGLRAAAGTPPPAPPSGSSPETPLDERDFACYRKRDT